MPPQKSDLRRTILNSNSADWEFIDMPETWVHHEEQIKIREVWSPASDGRIGIDQPDFASLPDDQHDQRLQVRISYQGVPFDQLPALSLDGHKITMIRPDRDHNTGDRYLTEYEASLSQIMSQDDFRRKQGNTIDVEIRSQGLQS